MNRSLALLVSAALALSAFAAACSSETVAGTSIAATDPEATADGSSGRGGDDPDSDAGDDVEPSAPKDDAGTHEDDAGQKDSAAPEDAGPAPFTKKEIQSLFDARCAPCHVGTTSAGLSLANDFTTTTVGVASTQVPGMKRIAAGDSDASYLLYKLRGTHTTVGGVGLRMPRSGPPYLSDNDIDRIGAFIDAL